MAAAIWLTPAGDLGIIPELEYYELQLDAYNTTGGALTYSVVSGKLPDGLELASSGNIKGIPLVGTPAAVTKTTTNQFTVRVKNAQGAVADRTFSLTVAGLVPPIIIPEPSQLGTYVDGSYVDIQLSAIEPNNLLSPVFSIVSGQLPLGLRLTASGRIYGYIEPTPSEATNDDAGFDVSAFGVYGFDLSGINVNKNFQFTVQANDGVNTDTNQYTIFVYARSGMTADNDVLSADNVSEITADISSIYNPILYTEEGSIGSVRQNTNFAFKFDAVDFNDAAISYSVVSGALPTGLTLNATSGWITGTVPFGSLGSVTYDFSVQVYKTSNPAYVSEIKDFSIKVVGQISDTVDWITPSDLGTIYNGEISDLYVEAYTPSGKNLQYSLISTGALPIGLSLLNDGSLSGRVSFECYANDGGLLTFDGDSTTFDLTYTFTIAAYDSNNTVYDERTFSVLVVQRDKIPYENLYIELMPSRLQRIYYDGIINNSDIFPPDSIYRFSDPWYGKNTARRSLFLTGLNPALASDYINAMTLNHYWKTLNFGEVKTAQALDDNFDVKYEVVYIELVDLGVNKQGFGPNLAVDLPANSRNVSTIYPNSFPNMIQRIGNGVGYENRSILPKWMTSRQTDGTVLGFTRALVLAYTKPGKGAEIAYRVSLVRDQLNLVDFTIDRYEWDTVLSDNFLKTPVSGSGTIATSTASNAVTGYGTIFNYELYPGKTLYVSNVAMGEVKTVTNNSSLILTTNAAATYGSALYTYSTNVFATNSFVDGTGTITANTQSNIVTGTSSIIVGTGVISGNTVSATITGTGTAFTTELRVGKTLYYANSAIGVITSIRSANVLTLSNPLTTNLTNVAYSASGVSTLFKQEIYVGDSLVVNIGGANVILGTVSSITSNTQLTLYANATSSIANVSYKHTDRDPYTVPGQGDKYLKYPQVGVLA